MSEGTPESSSESTPEAATEESTGLASVDSVVQAVEELEDRPVDEHVAVFEDAHDQLRRALDDAPAE